MEFEFRSADTLLGCHTGPVTKLLTDIQVHAASSLFSRLFTIPVNSVGLTESINRKTFTRHFLVNKPGFRKKQSRGAFLDSLVKRQLANSSSKLWLGLVGLIDLALETIILGRGSLVLFRLILLFTPPLFPRFLAFVHSLYLSSQQGQVSRTNQRRPGRFGG